MGILKTITEEYFGETIREEDKINYLCQKLYQKE